MNEVEIKAFIEAKEKRQSILSERKSKLEELSSKNKITKYTRLLGTSYLWLKKVFTLLLGLILIIGSLISYVKKDVTANLKNKIYEYPNRKIADN